MGEVCQGRSPCDSRYPRLSVAGPGEANQTVNDVFRALARDINDGAYDDPTKLAERHIVPSVSSVEDEQPPVEVGEPLFCFAVGPEDLCPGPEVQDDHDGGDSPGLVEPGFVGHVVVLGAGPLVVRPEPVSEEASIRSRKTCVEFTRYPVGDRVPVVERVRIGDYVDFSTRAIPEEDAAVGTTRPQISPADTREKATTVCAGKPSGIAFSEANSETLMGTGLQVIDPDRTLLAPAILKVVKSHDGSAAIESNHRIAALITRHRHDWLAGTGRDTPNPRHLRKPVIGEQQPARTIAPRRCHRFVDEHGLPTALNLDHVKGAVSEEWRRPGRVVVVVVEMGAVVVVEGGGAVAVDVATVTGTCAEVATDSPTGAAQLPLANATNTTSPHQRHISNLHPDYLPLTRRNKRRKLRPYPAGSSTIQLCILTVHGYYIGEDRGSVRVRSVVRFARCSWV